MKCVGWYIHDNSYQIKFDRNVGGEVQKVAERQILRYVEQRVRVQLLGMMLLEFFTKELVTKELVT